MILKRKKKKAAKKNTLYRKVRALDVTTDRRQQQRMIIPSTVDDSERMCSNCGHRYTGRVCPQCGQAGTWSRYTWKQAFLNLLDIWGLGNRPMFRTLRELFWRPGYMVRDYLNGHRQFYFPPFKLLALTAVFVLFTSWLTGVEPQSLFRNFSEANIENAKLSGILLMLYNALMWFLKFLSSNLLYEWLFIGVIEVLCIYVAFKFVSRYNLVETYIFLVFVLSQQLLLDIPDMMGEAMSRFLVAHSLMVKNLPVSTGIVSPVVGFISTVAGIVEMAYNLLTIYLFVLCFRQFYGLKWKATIWRMLLSTFVGIAAGVLAVFLIGAAVSSQVVYVFHSLLWLVLIPTGFLLARKYIKRNKASVSVAAVRVTKGAMLSLLFMPVLSVNMCYDHYKPYWSIPAVILYVAATFALSLLPIYLYKKYRNIWIACLPLLPLLLLVCLTFQF